MRHFYATRKTAKPLLFAVLSVMLFLTGCGPDDTPPVVDDDLRKPQEYGHELAMRWNLLMLDLERFTPGYRPPIAARTHAYIGIAAYESIQPGMSDEYLSIQDQFSGLVLPKVEPGLSYHWPSVLTSCYARSCELFFPTAPSEYLFRLYSLRNELFQQYKNSIDPEIFDRSTEYGRRVAQAVFNWSATDPVGHQAYLNPRDPNYVAPQGNIPGIWRPTFPEYSDALLPRWGQVRSFVAGPDDVCPSPDAYSQQPGSSFYQQALEVRDAVNQVKAGNRPEDAWIAIFWSDDCAVLTFTPAGRFIAVANQLLEQEDANLAFAIETYARVGIGIADAGIRAWHEKYRYNVERPISYIQRVFNNTNWNTIMCPDGTGDFFTPNFPAYPSGHATFGAVAAEIFVDLFGENYAFVDRCHEGRTEFDGRPRSFANFYDMAEENAYSRIPLGVHFRMDADSGLQLGYRIGRKINQIPWRR